MSRSALLLCAFVAAGAGLQDGPRHTISGRIVASDGRVPEKVELLVWQGQGDGGGGGGGAPVPVAADGSFTTSPLPPGSYVLNVGPGPLSPREPDGEGGLAIVELGSADVTGVSVRTGRFALRGKYVMRGDDPAAKWPSHIHVMAMLVAGNAPSVSVTADGAPNGEFVLRNAFGLRILRPGYTLQPGVRWSFAAVLLDGVDVTDVQTDFSAKPDATLEVVFTQHAATIEGTVTTAAGEPVTGAWIVEMSANPALWQTTTYKFQTGRDGRFSTRIRPARYLLAALPATPYQVRPVLGDLAALAARATPVTTVAGERTVVHLRLPR
jgi:hypothetical protein